MPTPQPDGLQRPALSPSLLDGKRAHLVLEFDAPAKPYTRADPWGLDSHKHRGCMNVGPVLVGATGSASHVPLPCFTHSCARCGPERAYVIEEDMFGRFRSCPSVWICSFVGPTADQLSRLLRTATRAVNRLGGNYLRLTMKCGSQWIGILLTDVDHSASPRGRPPRRCDPLDPGEATRYLTYMLWHGIVSRRSSTRWPLSDGERAQAGTSDRTLVGALGMKNMPLLIAHARRIYESDRRTAAGRGEALPGWSEYSPAPQGIDRADAISLWTLAHTDTQTELRNRRTT